MMLYIRPLSSWADYFTTNLEEDKNSLTDTITGGFLKQQAKSKIEENGKSLLEGNDSEPISYEWAFMIFRDKYQEPEGAPIVRIVGKLWGIGEVIYNELGSGVRNPAGVWGWLGQQKKKFRGH